MKKIVSNVLIVSTQLIVGGLFLFMLFSDSNEDNRVVVVDNNNLHKMADSVSELFVADEVNKSNDSVEVDLVSEEERKKAEEEAKKAEEARLQAEAEEAARLAEEARIQAAAEEQARLEEEARRNATIVSAGGYISKPAAGFNVTTGNRTYSLAGEELNVVARVVTCESSGNVNDALAVASVILNRADSRGLTPYQVVAQAGQFSCFRSNNGSTAMMGVLQDALNGIRNTSYQSFNGWYSGVSNNYIVSGGNRFY